MALRSNPYPVANGVRERATPDPGVLADAIDARESVYQVIVVKNLGGGKAKVDTGTGFAIRLRDDRCLILTCDHIFRKKGGEGFDETKDGIFVRKMCYGRHLRVREFPASMLYTDEITDLAVIQATGLTEVIPLRLNCSALVLGRTAITVGYCNITGRGFTRTPTVSPGITTSYPHPKSREGYPNSREGCAKRAVVDISCAGMPGNSGCPVVSLGGVIGVVVTGVTIVEDGMDTEHYMEAVSTSTVHGVMKEWLHLPANDPRTIDEVIEMLKDPH